MTGKASGFAFFLFSPKINVSKKSPAVKNTRRIFQIVYEFCEILTGRVITQEVYGTMLGIVREKQNETA